MSNLALYNMDALTSDPELQALVHRASPTEIEAMVRAMRASFRAGQEDSDARTGKLMARIFGAFTGVTPGCDLTHEDSGTPGDRMRAIIKMLTATFGGG